MCFLVDNFTLPQQPLRGKRRTNHPRKFSKFEPQVWRAFAPPTCRYRQSGNTAKAEPKVQTPKLLIHRPHEAEADATVVRAGRAITVAATRTNVPRVDAPISAPGHSVRARCRATVVGLPRARITPVPIPAPLIHIPMHILQPPWVGRLAPHRFCLIRAVVSAEPGHTLQCAKDPCRTRLISR